MAEEFVRTGAGAPTSQARWPRGFTLVELLVVVAILSLLLAMLTPAMRRARVQARRVVCASNVRQLAASCLNYAHSYRGLLPDRAKDHGGPHIWHDTIAFSGGGTSDDRGLLTNYLAGHTADNPSDVMFCPTANASGALCSRDHGWPVGGIWYASSYYYFGAWKEVSGHYQWAGSVPSPRLAATAKPATPLFSDLVEDQTENSSLGALSFCWWNLNHSLQDTALSLAPGQTSDCAGANAARVDGSAGWTDFKANQTFEIVIRASTLRPGHWWPRP